MEQSALNKAHLQFRRAENHLRYRKFDEAIDCHNKAAELLQEALSLTDNPRSLESLKLQRDYHFRQKQIILVKKEQFENYKKAIENQRQRMQCHSNIAFEDNFEQGSTSLQVAIYRTMEEADSLLNLLIKKGSGANSDSESLKSFSTDTDERLLSIDTIDSSNSNAIIGSKHPKDDSIVIEELRILNGQLHALVYKLVTQLDASTREVDMLKERIHQLEGEKVKATIKNSNTNLKVTTDSSGGTSPYVFTPCSELSPDIHDSKFLPALSPLELPNFNLSNYVKKNLNQNINSTN
ncbi:hypothetical protein FQR65_LT05495 [Abscondita terminalis]|nr:hypothetical protein FQR65_LT05495 [Abscondita terminalis]